MELTENSKKLHVSHNKQIMYVHLASITSLPPKDRLMIGNLVFPQVCEKLAKTL